MKIVLLLSVVCSIACRPQPTGEIAGRDTNVLVPNDSAVRNVEDLLVVFRDVAFDPSAYPRHRVLGSKDPEDYAQPKSGHVGLHARLYLVDNSREVLGIVVITNNGNDPQRVYPINAEYNVYERKTMKPLLIDNMMLEENEMTLLHRGNSLIASFLIHKGVLVPGKEYKVMCERAYATTTGHRTFKISSDWTTYRPATQALDENRAHLLRIREALETYVSAGSVDEGYVQDARRLLKANGINSLQGGGDLGWSTILVDPKHEKLARRLLLSRKKQWNWIPGGERVE
jgi:hypothetical protein